jgi:hypothetical protein
MKESIKRRIMIQASPKIKQDPISKLNNVAGGVAQVAGCCLESTKP